MSDVKKARDAIADEIFPGRHRPLPHRSADAMVGAMDALRLMFPGCGVTLFVAEPVGDSGAGNFNYISSGERADMVAVLKAFVERHAVDSVVDRIADAPPTETRQ